MTSHDDGLPNDPEGITLMIHALVDGELDAAAALAVERRIAADPRLAAEHARIVALRARKIRTMTTMRKMTRSTMRSWCGSHPV